MPFFVDVITTPRNDPTKIVHERRINYDNSRSRQWLAGHSNWALRSGHAVHTAAAHSVGGFTMIEEMVADMQRPVYLTGTHNFASQQGAEDYARNATSCEQNAFIIRDATIVFLSFKARQPGQHAFNLRDNTIVNPEYL